MKLDYFRQVSIISLILSLLLIAPLPAAADTATEFTNSHRGFFHLLDPSGSDIELEYLRESKRSAGSGSGEIGLDIFRGQLELALPLMRDFFLSGGVNYSNRNYEFSDFDTILLNDADDTLHEFAVSLGVGAFPTEKLLVYGDASLGIYSDLDGGLDRDDFELYGRAFIAYQFNPGAQLLGGAVISDDFEDIPLFPIVGVRLLSEDGRIHFSATVPLDIALTYNLTTRIQIFGRGSISGQTYNSVIDSKEAEIFVQDRRFSAGARFWLFENVNLSVEGGVAAESQFEIEIQDRLIFDGDLDSASFFAATLGISL